MDCPCFVNLQTSQITQRAKVQDLVQRSTIFFLLSKRTTQEDRKSLDLITRLGFHFLIPHEKDIIGVFQASSPVTQYMFPKRSKIVSSIAELFKPRLENASGWFNFINSTAIKPTRNQRVLHVPTHVHNLARRVLEGFARGLCAVAYESRTASEVLRTWLG